MIESRWGEIFRRPDRPLGPPSLLYNRYEVLPGGIKRPGRNADPSSLLVPWYKSRVELYLYSPKGSLWPIKRVKPTHNSRVVIRSTAAAAAVTGYVLQSIQIDTPIRILPCDVSLRTKRSECEALTSPHFVPNLRLWTNKSTDPFCLRGQQRNKLSFCKSDPQKVDNVGL